MALQPLQATAGWLLAFLESDLYSDPNESVEGLVKPDGENPTVREAIEYLKTLDPDTVLDRPVK